MPETHTHTHTSTRTSSWQQSQQASQRLRDSVLVLMSRLCFLSGSYANPRRAEDASNTNARRGVAQVQERVMVVPSPRLLVLQLVLIRLELQLLPDV